MQSISRIALGLGAAAVVAAGGSAFTEANNLTVGDNVVGYGTDTVTGAVSTQIKHTLSADGLYVASSVLTFAPDANTTPTVAAGFGLTGNLTNCVISAPTLRVILTAPYTATCTYGATSYLAATTATFRVAVS